jgi:hypothetical protein
MRPWPFPALAMIWALATGVGDCAPVAALPTPPADRFGAAAMDQALKGEIYFLPPGAARPTDFQGLRPAGAIYVRALNIPDQDWKAGFPGVASRGGWFAIDYHGTFRARRSGPYRFTLASDDDTRLLIDGRTVIDSTGAQRGKPMSASVDLSPGPHAVEAQYFQGPRQRLALKVTCKGPGGGEAIFPACGLSLKSTGLWRLWLWWVAALATLGAGVIWQTRRRIARETRGLL